MAKAYVANQGSNSVSVIDTTSNTVTATIPVQKGPTSVIGSPDGSKIYVANSGIGQVSIVDTSSNTVIGVAADGGGVSTPGYGLALAPNGKLYVSCASTAGRLRTIIIDSTQNRIISSVSGAGDMAPFGLAVTPDGSRLYCSTMTSGLAVIDTGSNSLITNIRVACGMSGVAVSPDGKKVFVSLPSALKNGVSVIDTASNNVIGQLPTAHASGMAVSPDSSKLYVGNIASNVVTVVDLTSNTVTASIPVGIYPADLALTADGSMLYVANSNTSGMLQVMNGAPSSVSVISTATNAVVATVPVGSTPQGLFIV
jgi:YVTN family beta-propeller protein